VQYQVTWSVTARRHLLALDKPARQQVGLAAEKLTDNPRPAGVKAAIGMPGVLRVRTGNYRVRGHAWLVGLAFAQFP
jgi:mRNA interferase RelE/StbE